MEQIKFLDERKKERKNEWQRMKQVNEWMKEWMRMKQMNEWMKEWMRMKQMNEWTKGMNENETNEWMDERMNENETNEWVDERMNENETNEWMDERVNENETNEWMDERMGNGVNEWMGNGMALEKSVHRERNESKNRVFHKISLGETVWTRKNFGFYCRPPPPNSTQLNPPCFKKTNNVWCDSPCWQLFARRMT